MNTMNTSDFDPEDEEYGNISTARMPSFDQRDLMFPEILIFVFFPLGLLTNCTFLFFIIRNKYLRTPFNMFLSNLSVGGIFFLTLAVAFTGISDKENSLVRGFCFLFSTSYVASSLFVSIVATERFLAVCVPLRYSLIANDKRRAGKICAAAWLTAVACGGLIKLVVYLFSFQKNALLFVIVFFCCVFLALNSVLYACIMWKLWKRPLASTCIQRRVVMKLAVTALMVFGIDTTHVVYIILHYFYEEKFDKTPFEMIVLALNAISLTINPLVYGLLNFNLQKLSLRKVLGRWCCKANGTQKPIGNQPPHRSCKRTLDLITDRTPVQTIDQ